MTVIVTQPMKRNDLLPQLQVQLLNGSTIVDLTTATGVKFFMKNAVVGLKVSGVATVTDAVNGKVAYTWVTGDTDTSGKFNGEFEVTWPSPTRPETFPNDSYLIIMIKDDLGP